MAEQLLATNIFPGDGSTTLFNVSFKGNRPDAGSGTEPYLDPSDVKAQMITPATATEPEVVVVDVPLTYIGPNQFSIASPIPVGKNLKIYRATEDEYALVDYQSLQTVSEADLDLSSRQNIFVMQEAHDLSVQAVESAGSATTIAYSAVDIAQAADDKADEAIATANLASGAANSAINTANAAVTTAGAAQTAANNAVSVANAATATANDALDVANGISETADNAVTIANGAVETANDALDVANGIDSKADAAIAASNTAISTANAATATANGIDAKATTALNTANSANSTASTALSQANTANTNASQAVTTANSVDAKATSALSTANAAQSTANQALSSANAAVKQWNNRFPDANGKIMPVAGDYSIADITGGTDASNLTSGTLPSGRLSGTYGISISGNAATAAKWTTARTLTIGNQYTGSASIDGSGDVTLNLSEARSPQLPTFTNGWSNYSGCRYYKSGNRVRFSGRIVRGSTDVTLPMFTLPEGYRPAIERHIVVPGISTGGLWYSFCTLTIQPSGAVYILYSSIDPSGGTTAWVVTLDGVDFELSV